MKSDNLFKRLSMLGFSLLETEEPQDANATLADMVKSKDLRLWESFPVVLANSAEIEYFSRVVKKKVLALANSELHRLAQMVLG